MEYPNNYVSICMFRAKQPGNYARIMALVTNCDCHTHIRKGLFGIHV